MITKNCMGCGVAFESDRGLDDYCIACWKPILLEQLSLFDIVRHLDLDHLDQAGHVRGQDEIKAWSIDGAEGPPGED